MNRFVAAIAVIAVGAAVAFGQEAPKPAAQKSSSNCLRIANKVDLAADLARLDELEERKLWAQLTDSYESLLKRTAGKLVCATGGIFTSAGDFLRARMAGLGPQAREAYRIARDGAAGRAYADAVRALDEERIESVVRDYPLSSFTDEALSLLGAIAAERGDFEKAAGYLERLFSWCPDTNLNRDSILIRAAWYSFRAGDRKRARSYVDSLRSDDGEKVEKAVRLRLSQLIELLNGRAAAPANRGKQGYVEGIPGGGFDRAGVSREAACCDGISWQAGLFDSHGVRGTLRQNRLRHNERRRVLTPGSDDYRYQAVVFGDKLYVGTEIAVNVFDLRTGKLSMLLACPGGGEFFPGMETYLAPTVTRENVYANFVHDVSKSEDYNGILIKAAIPRYTICAFDRATGKLQWVAHKDRKFREHFSGRWYSIPAAPVVVGGLVIAEVKTRGQLAGSHVAAFDAGTGRMKWVTPLCSNGTELTMFGYDARGPLSTMLACSAGPRPAVFCCTNLGAIFALDAASGEVRWASAYDQIPLRAARSYYAQMRNVTWANSPPIVSDGVLVATPIDSEYAYGYDGASGKMLWRYKQSWQRAQFRSVVGVAREMVVLAGARLAAIGLRTGKVKWLSMPYGDAGSVQRGMITSTQVLMPRPDGVYRFSLDSGKQTGRDKWPVPGTRNVSGNLLRAGDRLIVTGNSKITVYERRLHKR